MSSTKSNPNAARRVHHLARQFTRAVTGGSAAVPGAPVDEDALFSQTVADVEALFRRPRYKFTKRPYTAEAVARLRGSASLVQGGQAPLSSACADKLYSMLRGYMNNGRPTGEFSHTFGCLDPVQLVQMVPHLTSVYVSGWQSSSTASTSNVPGPDLADYPYDTVPNKVDQLFRAQQFHDRKQWEERRRMTPAERRANKPIDFFRPIIADCDTGHGGVGTTMKCVQMFIENGASGVHIEDQVPGAKKCGHMGGKVLVDCQTHITRLVAARMQADIMGASTVVVSRTDAEAATLLQSNHDPRDHAFILGATSATAAPLQAQLREAEAKGAGNAELSALEDKLVASAALKTFPEAVAARLGGSRGEKWMSRVVLAGMSLQAMRELAAKEFGVRDVAFDWDFPRSVEGYYKVRCGVELCIARGRAYAPYADLIWMETKKPGLPLARKFADGVHEVYPEQMLAYNCSPSFNWNAAGMSDDEIRTFQSDIAKMGYVWQFITLAGFHMNALGITRFARDYAKRHMLAYVETVQRKEREEKVSTLTHQKWSGAELIDAQQSAVMGGKSSTQIMSAGVTEAQFGAH